MPRKKPTTFQPVRNNPGIRAAYRRSLNTLLQAMHKDVGKALLKAVADMDWQYARDRWPDDTPQEQPII